MKNVLGRQGRSVKPLCGSIGNSAKLPLVHVNAHQFAHCHVGKIPDETAANSAMGNDNGWVVDTRQPIPQALLSILITLAALGPP